MNLPKYSPPIERVNRQRSRATEKKAGITPQADPACSHPATRCANQCFNGMKLCQLGSRFFPCPC